MLLVRIEIHPNGDSSRARTLSEMRIANVGGTVEYGDYAVELGDRKASVTGHSRLTSPVWVLVSKALRALHYDR